MFLAASDADDTVYRILQQWASHEDMVIEKDGLTCEDVARLTREVDILHARKCADLVCACSLTSRVCDVLVAWLTCCYAA